MRSRGVFVGVSLLALAVLLNLPLPAQFRIKSLARDNASPFQNVLTLVTHRIGEATRLTVNTVDVVDQNRQLWVDVTRLRLRLRSMEDLVTENERLTALLSMKQKHERDLLLASVTARGDAGGWWQSVRINRGAEDGVQPDLAVISPEGNLVGRTREVTPHTSTVLLLTDPACRVSCTFPRTGAFGVLQGQGPRLTAAPQLAMLCAPEPCSMEFIPRQAAILREDPVTTSGLGGVYPPGLLVGHITGSGFEASGLYQTATVEPAADLSQLRHLFVVIDHDREVAP